MLLAVPTVLFSRLELQERRSHPVLRSLGKWFSRQSSQTMMVRILLGGICTVLTLYIAVRSDSEKIRISSAFTASCLASFTATSLILESSRRHKSRMTHVDLYVGRLREMNRDQRLLLEDSTPEVCRGCCHYHGHSYGGERLICAMHPYGVDQEECSDRQEL